MINHYIDEAINPNVMWYDEYMKIRHDISSLKTGCLEDALSNAIFTEFGICAKMPGTIKCRDCLFFDKDKTCLLGLIYTKMIRRSTITESTNKLNKALSEFCKDMEDCGSCPLHKRDKCLKDQVRENMKNYISEEENENGND